MTKVWNENDVMETLPAASLSCRSILYCDVDGTLVPESNEISPFVSGEIYRFVDAGYGFTLATGRSYQAVKRLLPKLSLTAPLVLCNGAHVYDPVLGNELWTPIDLDVVHAVVPLLQCIPGVVVYLDKSDRSFWVSSERALKDVFALTEDLRPHLFQSIDEATRDAKVVKIGAKVIEDSPQVRRDVRRVFQRIEAEYGDALQGCFSHVNYLELMARGVSKWFGIQVSQNMKINRDELVMAVGDHLNDFEMISHADIGIAMGNAVPEIQEVASQCIGDVNHHGVGHFLHTIRNAAWSSSLFESPRPFLEDKGFA